MSDEKKSMNSGLFPGFPANFPLFFNQSDANNIFNHPQLLKMWMSINPELFKDGIFQDFSLQHAYAELSKFFSYGRGNLNINW